MGLFTSYFLILLSLFLWLSPHSVSAASLSLELNKVESDVEACTATVLIANHLGKSLDRFRIDMHLFASNGRMLERLMIDLAPLPYNRTTVASFPLLAAKCSNISRILVKDVPVCRAEGGEKIDCLSSLVVRTGVFIKISK